MAQTILGVVDAADVDGDGHRDLVGTSPESMAFVLVRGRGGRTFDVPIRIESGGVPRSVRAADWDGDGRADLVYSVAVYGRGQAMWRRSLGDGTFDAEHSITGAVDALDVVTDTNGRVRALVVAEDGHLKRYPVRTDARRAAEPDLDIVVPIEGAPIVRAVSRTEHVYAWTFGARNASLRVSLTDGNVCRYDLGTDVSDMGFFDDDAFIDATSSLTCSYCTSSYQLLLGTR